MIEYPDILNQFAFFAEFEQLEQLIFKGVEEAWLNAKETYKDESFYCFGLDMPFDLGAVYAGGHTIENYTRQCEDNKNSKHFDKDILFWSHYEWGDYQILEPQPILTSTWQWINARADWTDLDDDVAGLAYTYQHDLTLSAMKQALKHHDANGLFGKNEDRAKLFLFLWVGEACPGLFVSSFKDLNPKSVWDAFNLPDVFNQCSGCEETAKYLTL